LPIREMLYQLLILNCEPASISGAKGMMRWLFF
jgi:hypothetical protein